jgi:hypothetical protein
VKDPERDGFGGPLGENDEAVEDVADFIEQFLTIDGSVPWFNGW